MNQHVSFYGKKIRRKEVWEKSLGTRDREDIYTTTILLPARERYTERNRDPH
jgi:hypothetical protein